MAENSTLSRDIWRHALTTAVGVLVTFYVTTLINKGQYKKEDTEKEKQRMESLEKTSTLLNNYISRYDSLHEKYLALSGRSAANGNDDGAGNYNGYREIPAGNSSSVQTANVSGNWVTPDGTVGWVFSNGLLQVGGIGNYAGFFEAAGNYTISGTSVSGTLTITRMYYNPYNENYRFNLTMSSDGRVLYGNSSDAIGNSNAISLNRY